MMMSSLRLVVIGLLLAVVSTKGSPTGKDMDSKLAPLYIPRDTGTKILIQQHVDDSGFFQRTWEEFKAGFSDISGNYWIGNELLSTKTSSRQWRLRFELQSLDNSQWYSAEYSTFVVHNESTGYQLEVGGFSGDVSTDAVLGDPIYTNLNGMKFTTYDRDNDMSGVNCAVNNGGGFWYRDCALCNVNGQASTDVGFGWIWLNETTKHEKLRTSRMWALFDPKCPEGFVRMSSDVPSCYNLVLDNLNWNDAALHCTTLNPNAHLVVIDDEKENDVMKNLTVDVTPNCNGYTDGWPVIWTAGQRIDPTTESRFVWKISENRTAELVYQNWAPGEPNYLNNVESCLHLVQQNTEWYDKDCAFQSCSICEIDV